jgi:uncharacterized membrane protein
VYLFAVFSAWYIAVVARKKLPDEIAEERQTAWWGYVIGITILASALFVKELAILANTHELAVPFIHWSAFVYILFAFAYLFIGVTVYHRLTLEKGEKALMIYATLAHVVLLAFFTTEYNMYADSLRDLNGVNVVLTPILNGWGVLFGVFAAYCYLAKGYISRRFGPRPEMRTVAHIFESIMHVLLITWGYHEMGNLFASTSAAFSVFLMLYAFAALVIGMFTKSLYTRQVALVVFGITILKVFFVDITTLSELARIIAFMALGSILLVVGFLYYRHRDQVRGFFSDNTNPS